MNLQKRVKHINRKLTKYSRILFVLLSVTGIALSFFISNVSKYQVNRADTLSGEIVSGLSTNGVNSLFTLKNGSEMMVTYTNQWSASDLQINSHYDPLDYNQFSICDTGVEYNSILTAYTTSNDGTTYLFDSSNNELLVYYFDDCDPDIYNLQNVNIDDQSTLGVVFNNSNGDLYSIQEDRFLKFPAGNYDLVEEYNYINGDSYPTSVVINTNENLLYVLFSSNIHEYDATNSYSGFNYDISAQVNCAGKMIYQGSSIFIEDDCDNRVHQFNSSFSLEHAYQFDNTINDYTVNDDYIYITSGSYVTKYDKGSPSSTTVSENESDVQFVSIDYIGDDAMNLTSWYREVYRFTLTIGGGGGGNGCPVVTPEYVQSDELCQRFIYNNTENNSSISFSNSQSVYVDGRLILLQDMNQYDSGLWKDFSGYYTFPANLHYPIRMRVQGTTADNVFVLFREDDNNGGDPSIALFNFASGNVIATHQLPGGIEEVRDFVFDNAGNLVVINHDAPNSTSITLLQSGDYGFPIYIQSDFDLNSSGDIRLESDANNNLYVLSENEIRIVEFNGANYDFSSSIDLYSYNFDFGYDLIVKNAPFDLVDIYVSGSSSDIISKVQKFQNVDLSGNMDSTSEMLTGYGEYSSYSIDNIHVDDIGNVFAIPSQATNDVAWFTPDGAHHTIELPDYGNQIVDVVTDESNNLYVTSESINYQLFNYESEAAENGDVCAIDTPPYLENDTRCERYILNEGLSDDTSVELGENFVETVIDNTSFVASTDSGRLYANNNYWNLPGEFSGISNLKTDSTSTDGVYFKTEDSGDYTFIAHFNLDDNSYDFAYTTESTQDNIDYAIASNGDIYVIGQSFNDTTLVKLTAGDYESTTLLSLDFDFPGSCTPNIRINSENEVIALCGTTLRGFSIADPSISTFNINLTSHDFQSGELISDMYVVNRVNNNVDLYFSGFNTSYNGKVIRFSNFDSSGNYDSVTDFTDTIFNSTLITDIYVENNGSIFASSQNHNTQMARFLHDGTIEVIDTIVDHGSIVDILVDSNYDLYVTSSAYAYQLFEFDFEPPTFAGASVCSVGGLLSPTAIAAGEPINIDAWVDGSPDTPPYASGYIEIRANGLPISNVLLDGNGEASHEFTIFTSGVYTISFFYPGDNNYSSCLETIESVSVSGVGGGNNDSAIDYISITPSNSRQVTGEELILTFNVYDPNNGPTVPTGDVELVRTICCDSDTEVLATESLDSNGDVTFSVRNILPGNHGIFARYLGDSVYTPATTYTFSVSIFSYGTRLTVASSANPVTKGDFITLSANLSYQNVVPTSESPVEKSGWVRFRTADGTLLGEGLVDLNGDVSIVVNTSDLSPGYGNLNAGIHHVRAYYNPDHEGRNFWLRMSNSETLFLSVIETGSGGGSDTGTDIPPSGGEGGNSDFSAVITGKDKATGSLTETKIGSLLSWIMSYNNLGPNSNSAITYFPIRENQDYVVGSVVAPVDWTITYSQDQGCDDSSFSYTPVGANGTTDTLVRCIKFENNRLNVPPTRSDVRYITTSSNFSELNVSALGGTDVYKVIPDEVNNKLYYFNHHYSSSRTSWTGGKSFFCFDLEINDTCVSNNPDVVYPVLLGQDGWNNADDELLISQTGFAVNAEIVDNKLYVPMTNINYNDDIGNGHGFLCWDMDTDFYCNGSSFKSGTVVLNTTALNAWGWGNIGDVDYNPNLQEVYSAAVGSEGYMELLCYSTALDAPCPGQPYDMGTVAGYDIGWAVTIYQPSTDRIYSAGGGSTISLDRKISCLIATTKELCPDFPAEGTTVINTKRDQSVFINSYNDEMCVVMYSDGDNSDNTPPAMYCYDLDTESFYNYLPAMSDMLVTDWGNIDFNGPYPDGKFYMKSRGADGWAVYCFDLETKDHCEGWEGGRTNHPFDIAIYTMNEAFGCMWGASDTGRVFTFDEITGESCNPLITLTQGNVAVTLNANNMFCATSPDDITWNKVKVLDSGTSPSPALLNATVYDSTNCTTDDNNVISCTGSPLKSGNLLLNSGHELDISDIDYNIHKSLTAILEFAYPAVPSPAPGFYIELNPTNKAQMCAETKLTFSGALCANPITTVCENTNINYINDPVSNNNGGQYCLNVETYFGKDPNSALCFVAATPEQRIFTVFNPNATLAPSGTAIDFIPEQTYNRGPGNYSFGNGFFGFFQNLIETTIPQFINQDSARDVVTSISTQTPLAITAVTAVTTATVVATSVFAAGSGVGQIFGVLLGFLTPRKKKYWGIIFDDTTNKPVAFASITLSTKEIGKDNQMKTIVVTQAVSDLDGHYRLNTDKRDKFYLEVKASGYQPFTKFISMTNPLNSAEDIIYDIPMRRIDSRSNFFKSLMSYRKKGLISFARGVLLISSIFGFIFTIYSQINFPNNLNLVLLGVYIIIFIISFYPSIYGRIQKRGKVIDVDFNSPVPGAVVRIYDTKQQIALSLTNSLGEARFDLPSGEYSILASKRGYIMVVEPGKQLISAVLKNEGYLDRNILLKRIEEAPNNSVAGLDNPFA